MRKPTTLLLVLAAGLSCSKDSGTGPRQPPAPPPPVITVTPDSATVDLFDTLRLHATVHDSQGNALNYSVTWSSAYPNSVYVNNSGRVQALNRGTVTISAAAGGAVGQTRIKVKINVINVQVTPPTPTVQVGDTMHLHVSLTTGDGLAPDDSVPTWTSSDTAVATISTIGLVTGRHAGTATIHASVDSATGSATVTVPTPIPHVATVKLLPADTTVFIGDQVNYVIVERDSAGDTLHDVVTFTSTDTAVAPVQGLYWLIPKAAGVDTLVAVSESVTARAVLHVSALSLTGLAVGGNQACALATDSIPYCWSTGHPVHLNSKVHFASLSTSNGTCGLTATGAAYCIGDSAIAVGGGKTYASLTVGGTFVCGLDGTGSAWCWGAGGSGQLGDSSLSDSPVPVAVSGGHAFTTISTGYDHACGITAGGAAYCWGSNGGGMLGSGDTVAYQPTPVPVSGGLTFSAISAGLGYSCGITTSGDAYCWGANVDAQLGTGDSTNTGVPKPVAGGLKFSSISAGVIHTCALTGAGAAYCWGDDGALGSSTTVSHVPLLVSGSHVFTMVGVSSDINYAVFGSCGTASDGIYCWGNLTGSDISQSLVPVKVKGQP